MGKIVKMDNIWVRPIMSDRKLKWISTSRRLSLSARVEISPENWEIGISELDIIPIQKWCEENNCGVRTSFDTFKFKNKKQITLFLLRWS